MKPTNPTNSHLIGILSDTHGLVRPEVESALAGCSRILHAGDVGDERVLARLARIAPVTAVRGNTDYGAWSSHLPVTEWVEIDGICFYLLHELNRLDLDPAAADIHVVVSGHTHQPDLFQKDGVTYLNPGSAGHRRFDYPISVALIDIANGRFSTRIVEIDP